VDGSVILHVDLDFVLVPNLDGDVAVSVAQVQAGALVGRERLVIGLLDLLGRARRSGDGQDQCDERHAFPHRNPPG
jgi:hypothetical protein